MKPNSGKTISVLSACMALQMTSFVIILPLFARRFSELGAGVEALGISEMAYAISSTLAAPFMGGLADRLGRKPLVLVSLAMYALAFCGYLLAPSALAFIVIRGFAGAFTAGMMPAVTGLTADLAPRERQAQWIGFVSAGASFGWIAGPVAGGMIFDRWGYNTALIVSIAMAILAFLVALVGIRENRSFSTPALVGIGNKPIDRQPGHPGSFLRNLRRSLPDSLSEFLVLMSMVFAVLFAWAFIEPRFMYYAYNDLGWSSSMLGLVMSTYGIAMMIGELGLGRLSDRLGRKPVILVGLALFSAQFIGMAFFQNFILIAITFVIAGLGNALYDPALSAATLDISSPDHRSRILGIKSMVGSFGTILGPALVALLNSAMDARSIFMTSVGVVFLVSIIGLVFQGKEPFRKDERAGRLVPPVNSAISMEEVSQPAKEAS